MAGGCVCAEKSKVKLVPILKNDNCMFFLQGIAVGLSTPLPSFISAIPMMQCFNSWSSRARRGCGNHGIPVKEKNGAGIARRKNGNVPMNQGLRPDSVTAKIPLSPEAVSDSALQQVLRETV